MMRPMDYSDGAAWRRLSQVMERLVAQPESSCGMHECEPGWAWSPTLVDHDLWFVMNGNGWGSINGGARFGLEPGTLIWLRPGDRGDFGQQPDAPLTVLSSHFTFRVPGLASPVEPEEALLPNRRIQVRDAGVITGLFKQLIRSVREDSALSRIAARGQLTQLLAEVYRQDALATGPTVDETDSRLRDAMELIKMHPSRRQSLKRIAALVGLSPRALSQLFSSQLGITFRDFSVEARLARAQELLRETPMSVSQIARSLGYQDHVLFSRQFCTRFGQPPTQYRASVHRSDLS